ncbi:hypothetical protein Pint_12554 [Pistacia integerrima]|uniref:Uncharacterized protein n=1 Tax=Pistacia integerrima TaxID=434235 RepID=A0ACC0YCJ4_9ROSI|nr:hypothetical protein Pint_12554 [Pistacia integerrima]
MFLSFWRLEVASLGLSASLAQNTALNKRGQFYDPSKSKTYSNVPCHSCNLRNSSPRMPQVTIKDLKEPPGYWDLTEVHSSFISQMPDSFNKHFSYCLSSSGSSPGYITFGKTAEDIKDFPFVLGNVQQRGIDVHYDVANGKLGFAPGSCS